ncbi:hypothetical protein Rctr197k_118 [Virus Rctr197k]|nr:hypothetical protein Rctr197k_118 [Virus Rctr197k]
MHETKQLSPALVAFITEAKRLRAAAENAETKFMEFLLAGEKKPDLWRSWGSTDYPSFLEGNNICKAIRYIKYRNVALNLGIEPIREIGMSGILALSKLPTLGEQQDGLGEMQAFVNTNGTSISEQSAERIVQDTRMRDVGKRAAGQSYAKLLEDNKKLLAQNAELKERIKSLKDLLKQTKQKLRAFELMMKTKLPKAKSRREARA